jgi:hypothetical protein
MPRRRRESFFREAQQRAARAFGRESIEPQAAPRSRDRASWNFGTKIPISKY